MKAVFIDVGLSVFCQRSIFYGVIFVCAMKD